MPINIRVNSSHQNLKKNKQNQLQSKKELSEPVRSIDGRYIHYPNVNEVSKYKPKTENLKKDQFSGETVEDWNMSK